jgi:cystathionine beta-lyase
MNRDTQIQHEGEDRERFLGSTSPPIFRTSLFTFPDCASFERAFHGGKDRHVYTRVSNPTTRALEEKVALLEKTDDAIAFGSGMGAISAVLLAHATSGDHMICFSRAYSPTLSVARGLLRRAGVDVTFVEPGEIPSLEKQIRPSTRLIYVESPASLTFDVIDLEHVAAVARARKIPTATDNSWASPIYQQPATLGIDLVVHSGTKYIGGHSDLLLGIVAGKRDAIERVRSTAILLGASLSPEDAFLALRGLRTLPLRMQRHQESAFLIARRLLEHDRVADVLHPALPFFPSHALWKKQFSGASGLFAFRLKGDPRRFTDALRIFRLGVSWGGFESLILPVAVLAPAKASDEQRPDISPDVVRLSIGFEDPEDLWEDLARGFAAL